MHIFKKSRINNPSKNHILPYFAKNDVFLPYFVKISNFEQKNPIKIVMKLSFYYYLHFLNQFIRFLIHFEFFTKSSIENQKKRPLPSCIKGVLCTLQAVYRPFSLFRLFLVFIAELVGIILIFAVISPLFYHFLVFFCPFLPVLTLIMLVFAAFLPFYRMLLIIIKEFKVSDSV